MTTCIECGEHIPVNHARVVEWKDGKLINICFGCYDNYKEEDNNE